ncbi:MAG: hypothetical protein ACLVJO_02680 [[Clostridium] scindens]
MAVSVIVPGVMIIRADGRRVLCRHGNLTGYLCAELWTVRMRYIVNPLTGMFSDGSNVNFVAFILAGCWLVLTVIMLGWGIKAIRRMPDNIKKVR